MFPRRTPFERRGEPRFREQGVSLREAAEAWKLRAAVDQTVEHVLREPDIPPPAFSQKNAALLPLDGNDVDLDLAGEGAARAVGSERKLAPVSQVR